MKFKVGQKVRIVPLEKLEKTIAYVTPMERWANKIVTIQTVLIKEKFVRIKEDTEKWNFSVKAITPLEEWNEDI